MESEEIVIGSQKIAYYESSGKGLPLLFIHGNSTSGRAFKHQLESPLGEKYRFIALDLPGHGKSDVAEVPDACYSLPGMAELIVSFAECKRLNRAIFVGWSLGGHILLEAAKQLFSAAGIMIFGTPPVANQKSMSAAFSTNPAVDILFKDQLSQHDRSIFTSTIAGKAGSTDIDCLEEDILKTDGTLRGYIGKSIASEKFEDEVKIINNISTPLAILHGEDDNLVNLSYISSLSVPTLWKRKVHIIPDASHAPHLENPQIFNKVLANFIADVYEKNQHYSLGSKM